MLPELDNEARKVPKPPWLTSASKSGEEPEQQNNRVKTRVPTTRPLSQAGKKPLVRKGQSQTAGYGVKQKTERFAFAAPTM